MHEYSLNHCSCGYEVRYNYCVCVHVIQLAIIASWINAIGYNIVTVQYPSYGRMGGSPNRSGWHGEENLLRPYWDSNSDPSVIHPIASCYTDCTMPSPKSITKCQINLNFYQFLLHVFTAHAKPFDSHYLW